MAPNTTKTGIGVIDNAFGGIYLHLPTVICGRRKSGKFVFALQFLVKTIRAGERIILFTSRHPEEIVSRLGQGPIDVDEAISTGQLVVCPYASMHHQGADPHATLPFPEVMDELASIVKDNDIRFAIFDTVVPWTAIQPLEAMPDHVDSFVSALSSLGLTSLLMLPEPASPAAESLATVLRQLCPVNIELESRDFGANFILRVTKYQGMAKARLPMEFALDIVPGVGFEALGDAELPQLDERPVVTPGKAAAPEFHPFLSPAFACFRAKNGRNPAPPRS